MAPCKARLLFCVGSLGMSAALRLYGDGSVNLPSALAAKADEEFKFDASLLPTPSEAPASDVVVAKRITVSEFFKLRLLEQTMHDAEERRLREETFSLEKGGPIASKTFGKFQTQIGIWPNGPRRDKFDILKLRW
jgi:hypothetical protein